MSAVDFITLVRKRRRCCAEQKRLWLRKLAERPTYGYRRVTVLLNRYLKANGPPMANHKRLYRIMRVNHLLLPKHTRRPIRVHDGSVITLKSNMRWSSDVFEVLCYNREESHPRS